MQLNPRGTSIKATVLMHIVTEKDDMNIPQLQERTLITRGSFPDLTPIREVQTPQTPVQQQATANLGGGGSAVDDLNNESEDEHVRVCCPAGRGFPWPSTRRMRSRSQ